VTARRPAVPRGASARELADLAAMVSDAAAREAAVYSPMSPVARGLRQASGLLLVASRAATDGTPCRACDMPEPRCLAGTGRCCGGCSHRSGAGRGPR
jgi:hypothetical protein